VFEKADLNEEELMKRIALLSGLAVLAVAVPAQGSHECQPHKVSYEVSGTIVQPGSALVQTGKHTYSGTLIVHVTKTNNHAKADKGSTKSYTLTNAKVDFEHGVNHTAPAAGSRVHLKGTITTLPKHCSHNGFTPTIAIHKVEIKKPTP
jgi:hypothetical protein